MKFIIDNIAFIILALVSGGLLLWPALQKRGPRANTLQATQLINQGKTTILDIRDAAEFATGHLRESRNIPLPELAQRVGELQKAKAKTVLVVCQSGTRAGKAVSLLLQNGFTDVYALDGGLAAWQAQGLPVHKPQA